MTLIFEGDLNSDNNSHQESDPPPQEHSLEHQPAASDASSPAHQQPSQEVRVIQMNSYPRDIYMHIIHSI